MIKSGFFGISALFLLTGCASDTGVIEADRGTFFIEKQQATGAPGLGNLRAEVYNEGNAFCRAKGLSMRVIDYSSTQPPYILGNYPRVSLSFACS